MSLAAPPHTGWHEQRCLVSMGGDAWRIKDACEGTVILGATGSGKTSGSGRTLARAFLEAGFGGLVLCAKPDEPELWKGYAAEAGRTRDMEVFGTGGHSFNFLRHESLRQGAGSGLTENIVNLFMEVASIGSGESGRGGGDPFWDRAMRSLIRNAVDVLSMACEPVSLHGIFEVLRGAPQSPSIAESEEWRARSPLWAHVTAARQRAAGTGWEVDLREVEGYWLDHFPALGEKTRGSIVAMFTTLAEGLMRGKMRELFCGETTLAPEDVLSGKIVVVDLPVKEWAEVGRVAAVIWKYAVQKAAERRPDNACGLGRPIFIWADECQHFASRYDPLFQATARSSRAASVYLTQNTPSLAAVMGAGGDGRTQAQALLGNLGTKIFHANSDRDTNLFASELVGRRIQSLRNFGSAASVSTGGQPGASSSLNRGRAESMDLEIQPVELSRLRKGGAENEYVSEALVFQNGRVWEATQRTWQKVAFHQAQRDLPAPAAGRRR